MTHDEMIAVIQAHKEGKVVQFQTRGRSGWESMSRPNWDFFDNVYRVKPAPQRVPLTLAEIPPGTVIAISGSQRLRWNSVTEADTTGLWYASGSDNYSVSFKDMVDGFVYWPPGATAWLPCYKEQS